MTDISFIVATMLSWQVTTIANVYNANLTCYEYYVLTCIIGCTWIFCMHNYVIIID